jgi:predicted nucleotidyltransferase
MAPTRNQLLANTDVVVYRTYNKSLSLSEMDKYDEIKKDLQRLDLGYRNSEIYFFGSRTFSLGHKGSDLDIFFELGEHFDAIM